MRTRLLPPFAAALLLLGACAQAEPVSDDPGPTRGADRGNQSTTEDADEPSDTPDTTPDPEAGERTAAAYFIGDTERAGPRLYREFQRHPGDALAAAVAALAAPRDPDYRTAWAAGRLTSATYDGDVVRVVVDPTVRRRPGDMSKAEATAAVQQVVYTMQAAVQERAPVQFTADGDPIDQVFGVPTAEPLAHAPMLDVLAHASLTTPEQGQVVDDGSLEVTGVGNSFEASLGWELRQGDRVVDEGYATMAGWMEPRLFPFETTVDVSGLDPGDYTLWITTDDPTGGTEGIGAMTDDREFVVE